MSICLDIHYHQDSDQNVMGINMSERGGEAPRYRLDMQKKSKKKIVQGNQGSLLCHVLIKEERI